MARLAEGDELLQVSFLVDDLCLRQSHIGCLQKCLKQNNIHFFDESSLTNTFLPEDVRQARHIVVDFLLTPRILSPQMIEHLQKNTPFQQETPFLHPSDNVNQLTIATWLKRFKQGVNHTTDTASDPGVSLPKSSAGSVRSFASHASLSKSSANAKSILSTFEHDSKVIGSADFCPFSTFHLIPTKSKPSTSVVTCSEMDMYRSISTHHILLENTTRQDRVSEMTRMTQYLSRPLSHNLSECPSNVFFVQQDLGIPTYTVFVTPKGKDRTVQHNPDFYVFTKSNQPIFLGENKKDQTKSSVVKARLQVIWTCVTLLSRKNYRDCKREALSGSVTPSHTLVSLFSFQSPHSPTDQVMKDKKVDFSFQTNQTSYQDIRDVMEQSILSYIYTHPMVSFWLTTRHLSPTHQVSFSVQALDFLGQFHFNVTKPCDYFLVCFIMQNAMSLGFVLSPLSEQPPANVL